MAEETFYSALHWAKKAEASAKLAAENAQSGGALLQLGFDGSIEGSQLVFKHAPAGVDTPYQLVDDVEYEIDLYYPSTGTLAETVKMQVKNGTDVINFVSAMHRDSTTPTTVGDMSAVMRFDASTGYRWLFKAAYKIAPNGAKVFLLYPVVAKDVVTTSGNQTIAGTKTFTNAPKIVNTSGQNIQILLSDTTANSEIGLMQATSNGKNQFLIRFANGNKYPFVISQDPSDDTKFSFTITGSPAATSNTNEIATTAWVNTRLGGTGITSTELGYLDGVTSAIQTQLNAKAPLASPALTGTPTAPTPGSTDNSTKIATTAWVNTRITAVTGGAWTPNYGSVTSITASGYTAPSNGWGVATISSNWGSSSSNGFVYVNNVMVANNTHTEGSAGKGHTNTFIFPVKKGNKITYTADVSNVRFIAVG